MAVTLVMATVVAILGSATQVFLTSDDLVEAHGVTLEAQLPEPGLTLETKDSERPKLWYAPVSAEAVDGRVRVWYQRVDNGEKEFSDRRVLCVGEIAGGAWQRCSLEPTPPVWGGANNVCMRRSPFTPSWGGFNVFQILRVGSEYRMVYWDQPAETGDAGAMLATSADGILWRKEPGAVFTEHNDAFTVLPHGSEFLLYQTVLEDWPDKPYSDNLDKKRRVISLRRSSDLKAWTPQEVFLRPDGGDKPETEFYLMKAFPYGPGFAAIVMKYYADPKLPGKHSAILSNELLVSSDAVHWQRPFRNTDLGFWSYADPFMLNDRLHFVIWKDSGMCTVSYSPDRLIGVVAGKETGSFITRPFRFTGTDIQLNADVRNGWIEAELLSGSNQAPADPAQRVENADGETHVLHLTRRSPKDDATAECRLRFRLHNATVFAFISRDN